MTSLIEFVAVMALALVAVPGTVAAEFRSQDKEFVIVTLGDSITRGVRPGVKDTETLAALLNAVLTKKGIKANVVNVGIGGERTDQALAMASSVGDVPSAATARAGEIAAASSERPSSARSAALARTGVRSIAP